MSIRPNDKRVNVTVSMLQPCHRVLVDYIQSHVPAVAGVVGSTTLIVVSSVCFSLD